jgi:hypothetical protein
MHPDFAAQLLQEEDKIVLVTCALPAGVNAYIIESNAAKELIPEL